MTYVALSCRALLGAVFLVSGLTKVTGRGSFRAYARSVRRLGSLPRAWALPVARAVVTAELLVVGLLAVPQTVAAASGFALAGLLLVVFSAAIVRSLGRGDTTPCRCFGATSTPLGARHVARNAFLAAAALLGSIGGLAASSRAGRAGLAGLAISVVIGLVLGWLVTQFDHFAELFGPSELFAARRPS